MVTLRHLLESANPVTVIWVLAASIALVGIGYGLVRLIVRANDRNAEKAFRNYYGRKS